MTIMRKFLAALETQSIVMQALILREAKSFQGGNGFSLFWMFAEPMVISAVVIGLHWAAGGNGIVRGIPVVAFILTGYCPHLLLRHGGLAGVGVVNSDMGLLYHRQIHFLDLVFSKLILEASLVIITFIVMFSVFYYAKLLGFPRSLGYLYLGWFLHIWFAFALAFIFSGLALRWRVVGRFFQPFAYSMIPIYGAFAMLYWLPENIRNFFPPANATEVMRRGYFGTAIPTYFSIPYTVECNLLLTFIGLLTLMHARNKLEA
jgi:capsular polysaccharide transport system permease protein